MRFLMKIIKNNFWLIVILGLISSCSPATATMTSPPAPSLAPATLKAYILPSQTPAPAEIDQFTPSPLPSPSPTPRTHTVTLGETFGTIATIYGVSVNALIQANPDVNPNAMIVGTVLIIPPVVINGEEQSAIPTPIGVTIQSPACYTASDKTIACFVMVINPLEMAVEGVSAILRYQVSDGNVREANAFSLLNTIPPGASVPLYAAFPTDSNWDGTMSVELRSAIPSRAAGNTSVTTVNTIEQGSDGNAWVSGTIEDPDGSGDSYWLMVAGFDDAGKIVGARRFTVTMPTDANLVDFNVELYSMAGTITRVEALAEPVNYP
jgi:LysM repeat protein